MSATLPPTLSIAPGSGIAVRWLGDGQRIELAHGAAVEQACAEVPAPLRAAPGALARVWDPSGQSSALVAALEGAGFRVERVDDAAAFARDGAELAVLSLDAAGPRAAARALARRAMDDALGATPALLTVSRHGHDDVRLVAARDGAAFLRLPARPLELARVAHELTATRRRVQHARRQTEELRLAQTELVHAERLATLGWLAASVGHDLRTPLAAIRSNSDLALKAIERVERECSSRSPAVGQALRTLAELERTNLKAVDRLADIVRGLKSVARPDDGPRAVRDVALGDVVREALALCAHELRNVRVDVAVPDDLPRVGFGHAELMQVVMNLVVNAAHAIGARGGRVDLRAAPRDGGGVVLSVVDDGPGIDPAIMPRLFHAGVTTRAAQGGTGLGLSIVKRLVELHGGAIDVVSEPGGGARFRVALPCAGSSG